MEGVPVGARRARRGRAGGAAAMDTERHLARRCASRWPKRRAKARDGTTEEKAMAGDVSRMKAELMAKPEFKASYDALEGEFALARAIIEARVRAGLTQEQVAEKMGTSLVAVERLEAGQIPPSTKTLLKFAEATGTRLSISFQPTC